MRYCSDPHKGQNQIVAYNWLYHRGELSLVRGRYVNHSSFLFEMPGDKVPARYFPGSLAGQEKF